MVLFLSRSLLVRELYSLGEVSGLFTVVWNLVGVLVGKGRVGMKVGWLLDFKNNIFYFLEEKIKI